MEAVDYTSLCNAVASRQLGPFGFQLGKAFLAHLPAAEITPPLRLAHFVAQVAHETDRFNTMFEYGGPSYFAKYDGRKDLGNTQPGDGYRYRGRGLIQITGRANYAQYGQKLSLDLLADPDLAAEPDTAANVASRFWVDHGLNALADAGDIVGITRRINGGENGLTDRQAMFAKARTWIDTH